MSPGRVTSESPAAGSGKFVVAINGLLWLQRCVMIAATVSSTHSLIRRAPKIVEQQYLRIECRAIGLAIRGAGCRIPSPLNTFQQ